ncbi:hypothetical protein [Sapientia aquatica]|uniref:Uncharacterized protein n=1 Tax=Sapientia aquatica TaxID=1549640 RepID=A0A4R5W238_9BURK|nr:hypothetical protein [Sapientia aquatica]TDK66403.1 hypothetical protein E2I14_07975 [Sapientia aquatica]
MGKNLSPKDSELYNRIDEVLHYIWDPIRVSGVPMARDEYHSYLPQVFSLVKEDASPDQIANYLIDVVTNKIGLSESMDHALEVVNVLQDWKRVLGEKYDNL